MLADYSCGMSLSQTLFASPLLFPVTSMTASIHALLLENSTCQAFTDSTKEFPIIPTDATTASMIISVYNLFGFLLRKTEYKRILKCFYTTETNSRFTICFDDYSLISQNARVLQCKQGGKISPATICILFSFSVG